MRLTCFSLVSALAGISLLGGMSGCGGSSAGSTGSEREARGVLRVLGIEYANFATEHDGKPPADKDALAAFLETRKSRIPGLKSVDQLFVSPRDNQPLVIYYGDTMPPVDESGFPVVAREQVGAGGKCLLTNTRGGVTVAATDQVPAHLASPD